MIKTKAYKDKQYLVFEFEDGKNVKYNLATGETIGKLGRPVKDICTQLRGYTIPSVIKSFADVNYSNFLNFVDSQVNRSSSDYYRGRCDKIRNLGSFLAKLQNYTNYEQFFACGIQKVDENLNCGIQDVPKGLLKICREKNIKLTSALVAAYERIPNEFNMLMYTDFNSISPESVVSELLYYDYGTRWRNSNRLHTLVNTYHYNIKALFLYVDNLITYEALTGGVRYIVSEIFDYVEMMSKISPKYEKYPKNFLTTHRIATRNYERLKEQFEEADFQARIDKELECVIDEYKIIYPKTVQDIRDEAISQNHCVASYIKRVIQGECHILFMRKKDSVDKSLITLEVRNGRVVQARGKYNRETTSKEREAINKWNSRSQRKEKLAC